MIASRQIAGVIIAAAVLVAGAAAQDAEKAKAPARQPAAKALIELLAQGEFAKVTETFDATMTKVMPPALLKKTWEKILSDAGAFKKQLSSRQESAGKYDVVFVTCEFARMQLEARVMFDKDAKVAGLFVSPMKKPLPTGKEQIYEGTLKAGAVEMRLIFHLFQQKDGSHAATMDSPAENLNGIVLDEISIKDDAIRLALHSAKFVYEGKLSENGREIVGTFKQAGQSLPLTLKRAAKATEPRRPQKPK